MRHLRSCFFWDRFQKYCNCVAIPSSGTSSQPQRQQSCQGENYRNLLSYGDSITLIRTIRLPSLLRQNTSFLKTTCSFFCLSSEKNSTIAWTVAMKSKHRKNIWKNNVKADALSFVCFQSMAASQSGVHLDPAVLHVGLASKFDFATAPILLRSTMAPIVLGPAPKRTHATMDHVQVDSLSFNLLLNKWM